MGIASNNNLLAQARPDTLATSLPPTTEQLQDTSLSYQTADAERKLPGLQSFGTHLAEDASCIHISTLTDLETTFRTRNEAVEGENRRSHKKLSSS